MWPKNHAPNEGSRPICSTHPPLATQPSHPARLGSSLARPCLHSFRAPVCHLSRGLHRARYCNPVAGSGSGEGWRPLAAGTRAARTSRQRTLTGGSSRGAREAKPARDPPPTPGAWPC
eukprot:jgi/Tetstr1/433869/TSEL_023050.t1